MHEELGVEVDDWVAIGPVAASAYHRHDRMHCFRAELSDPRLLVDRGEIDVVEWFPRGELPARLNPEILPILRRIDGATPAGR